MMTFSYLSKLDSFLNQELIEVEDNYPLRNSDKFETVTDRFMDLYEERCRRGKTSFSGAYIWFVREKIKILSFFLFQNILKQ